MAKPSSSGSHFLSAALLTLLCITTLVTMVEARCRAQETVMKSSIHQTQTVIKRLLIGSAPPSCRARCGQCRPCHPVQVAIQPSMVLPMEYYPIVWRCQCANKLYLP